MKAIIYLITFLSLNTLAAHAADLWPLKSYQKDFILGLGLDYSKIDQKAPLAPQICRMIDACGYNQVRRSAEAYKDRYTKLPCFLVLDRKTSTVIGKEYILEEGRRQLEVFLVTRY